MSQEQEHLTDDWASHLTERLEGVVSTLRNYSVRPALGAVRFLLLGAVGSIIGVAVLVALVIGVAKLLDTDVFGGRVWATDFLIGGILLLAGAFLFRAGVRKKDTQDG